MYGSLASLWFHKSLIENFRLENTVISFLLAIGFRLSCDYQVISDHSQVHVTDVYLPNVCVNLFVPDKRAYFCMYDRVVNVRPDIAVPLGLKGTVIGIHR